MADLTNIWYWISTTAHICVNIILSTTRGQRLFTINLRRKLSEDKPARRPVFCDVQNAPRHEERQVRRRVGGRVVRPQALIGRGVADDQRLLPQQRLAEHLLPPVVHLRGEVVRVSPEQLIPASLQKDAVLPHT